MASERDRILKLKEFLLSKNIDVNIGVTKARGNKGVFLHSMNHHRIDISKDIPEEGIIPVMLHEFAHYVHYKYDKSLKSLDFIFGEIDDEIREELINITVRDVPKNFASSLFETKNKLSNEVKNLSKIIKSDYPDFKISEKNPKLEKGLTLAQKYMLSYDRVKIFNKIYSIDKLEEYDNLTVAQAAYIRLKSNQRKIKRISSKINRLNRYYNNPSELLARFTELYFTKRELAEIIAPNACQRFEQSSISCFNELKEVLS